MTSDPSPVEVWHDPIVAEVRKVREALFAEADYDIHEFCRRLSARQAGSGHLVVKRGSPSTQDSIQESATTSSGTKAG
jgi:hypothetical protein